MTSRPLLYLVMIVKDESASIEKTLSTALPYVDGAVIMDTGSSDGTQKIVEQTFSRYARKGVEHRLVHGTFVDFATTRNAVLDEVEKDAPVFTLMLSGDEYLSGGNALREFLRLRTPSTVGAYYVPIEFGDTVYDSARIARVDSKWRYVGVTHEVLVAPDLPITGLPSDALTEYPAERARCSIRHEARGSKVSRWLLDVELLEAEWKKTQTPRTAFYLGQSYDCLGNIGAALKWYEHRASMGGWYEEVYESRLRSARLKLGIVPEEGVRELLAVYQSSPHRAEPLYALALHYYRAGSKAVALMFARAASKIPYPSGDRLFVDASVYCWRVWDLIACCTEDVEEGSRAANKARLGNPNDERIKKNYDWWQERAR